MLRPPPSLQTSRIFRQILLGFGMVMVTLSAGLLVSAIQFSRLQGEIDELLGRQFRMVEDIGELRRLLAVVQGSKRGFLITGNDEFRSQYERTLVSMDPVIERLRRGTDDHLTEREHLLRFRRLFARYLQVSARDIATREDADREGEGIAVVLERINRSRGPGLSSQCDQALLQLHRLARIAMQSGQEDVSAARRSFRELGLLSMALALIVTLVWGTVVARDIGRSLSTLKHAMHERSSGTLTDVGGLTEREDEIGDLAQSFEEMSAQLAGAERTLRETVSDQSRLLVELRETNEALGRAMRVKSDFLATMSHELRTPLNAVIGLSGMLLDSPSEQLSPRARTALASTRDAGTHLLTLLNDILDLAKVDAGRMSFALTEVDPDPIARVCIATVMPLLDDKAVTLRYEASEAPLVCHADPQRLRQILLNLLANAVKFTSEGQITLRLSRLDRVARFEVEDTGIGIASEDLDHLFEEFRQAASGDRRPYGGTGLGLALSRRMARPMGGDIAVTSEVGVGSRFVLTVPLAEKESV